MKTFVIVILLIVLVLALWKWITWKIASKAITATYERYLLENKVKSPSSDKIKNYQSWAIDNMVKDFFHLR